ncbi:MAG: LytTR family DNA-binding domain-containing protein [Bacteroidales bacterium]|nr:LytTR family DNA-binding domain-containing protein [Bacteroidales bacterium]MCM1415088.1 LytTR family DNA-binding domain-containing protein [bacterium]MCM1424395.1 LytTR family DNA-binding domain-containing protein [bacterium]
MTYQTALCDDERAELEKTERLLNAYQKSHPDADFLIRRFESAEELLFLVEGKSYAPDLIFMDIFMPDGAGGQSCEGMEAARKLRDLGSKAKLLFLTTSGEYALEAFGVDAWQYLLKPLTEERLFTAMDKFLEDAERKKCVVLKIDGRMEKIPVSDIVYIEAQRKTQCLYLTGGAKRILRATMTELFALLSAYPEFVRIGAGFIVNLEYVDSLTAREICLHNGKSIFMPRGAYKEIREAYLQYYCG